MSISFDGFTNPADAHARPIHVAIGSTMSCPGDLDANMNQIASFAARAAADGADILLTPELSATGYGSYPDVLALAEQAGNGAIYRRLAGIAGETGVVICAGFPELADGKRLISQYTVFPGGKFEVQRKHRAMPMEAPFQSPFPLKPPMPGEEQGQPTATSFNVFEVKGVRCAVVICYDFGITGLNALLAEQGVELLLLATGAGGKREDRFTLSDLKTAQGRARYAAYMDEFRWGNAPAECMEFHRAFAAVNICGYDGREYYHGGNGVIFNCFGEVAAYLPFISVLERQRPTYAHAIVDIEDKLTAD